MKYRTKLYLAFVLLVFSTTLVGLSLVYFQARETLIESLHSKVLTVAATSTKVINGDLLQTIHTREDMDTPAFKQLVQKMRALRDANRRSDLYVIYIYTIRPSPTHQNQIEVVVDATEDMKVFAYPGELYPEGKKIGILHHIHEVWSPKKLITDRWGTFLAGYAPVLNSEGQYVATLGVNLSAKYVIDELGRFRLLAGVTLLLTLIGGLIAATILSHFVTHSLDEISEGVQQIGLGNLKTRIHLKTKDEFENLAVSINEMAKNLEESERLKLNFVRYVSKHVMEKILSSNMETLLKGKRTKVTILVSDIRKFTYLSERLSPEDVVSILNEYLETMLNVIFENNGTLDKFMGDAIRVEFGAPIEDPNQEKIAVKTAIEMQLALKTLNRKWEEKKGPHLEMGIGIHTGEAVIGNVGSERRTEYTAIGDTVIIATALESATKKFKVPILISETTMECLEGQYNAKTLGPLVLPNREKPLNVYSIDVPSKESQ